MIKNDIINGYFEWMYDLVCENRYSEGLSYRKLLSYLHNTEFTYFIPKDANRAEDGVDLRRRFADYAEIRDIDLYLDEPCSVLEMMIALAIRCETFMDDTRIGDRTGQWFWGMIVNLGLGSMFDNNYDRQLVETNVTRFLEREYEYNGKGGLFTVKHCDRDLRGVEIWYQLCWYLDSII